MDTVWDTTPEDDMSQEQKDLIINAVELARDGMITQGEMLRKIATVAEVEHFWDIEGNPIPLDA
jgi:hypothetical protein